MSKEITNIKTYIESLGYKVISPDMHTYIQNWIEWYKGDVDDFHKYSMYNGFKFVDMKRASLRMTKRISEEWSSLLYNDKVCISVGKQDVTENKDQKQLEEALSLNKFNYKFSELIERTFALGIGATVVYKDNKGKPKIDYIIAPMIFPLKEENGEIIDCAFGSYKGNDIYVNIHERQPNGSYKITNKLAKKGNDGTYKEAKIDGVLESSYSKVKMFQIFKPNIANNLDLFSPFGISVYANAIEQNKAIDMIYDSFRNEFNLGKKRLFLKTEALTFKTVTGVNAKGETTTEAVPIFDENQTEFFALPGEEKDDLITEINSQLRITEHIDGLQTALNLFSDACGLGPDRFVFRDGKVYTNADQVISTKSKLYKNILNHEKILRYSITELIEAIMFALNGKEYTEDISIDFDDSIVQDTEKIRQQALLEFNAHLIDEVQYYQDVYGMTEKQATEFRDKIKNRTPQEKIDDEGPEGA